MKVVILAGGKGTRLSEYTKVIPKPMVKIGRITILEHIMNFYISYGFSDFLILTGYKSFVIENYLKGTKYNVKVLNTGLNSLTGLRLHKAQKFLKKERFFLTYGDGLSNVNLNKLLRFHIKNKSTITLTSVHPPARFGELIINKNKVSSFQEKPQLQKGWINGGFFVVEPSFFKFINHKNVMLERDPIAKAVKAKKIYAYKHKGFWFCMDNMRDKEVLESLNKKRKVPWIK